MINEKLYYLIILVFSVIPLINLSYSLNENLETYSNSQMGLEFKFPFSWELQTSTTIDKNCNPSCGVSFLIPNDDEAVSVNINSYNLNDPVIKSKCRCDTLKEFVKYSYESGLTKSLIGLDGQILSDNPILINNNVSGWEMESKFKGFGSFRQNYDFWTLQNDIGYSISYIANEGVQYEKYLSEVKDMIK